MRGPRSNAPAPREDTTPAPVQSTLAIHQTKHPDSQIPGTLPTNSPKESAANSDLSFFPAPYFLESESTSTPTIRVDVARIQLQNISPSRVCGDTPVVSPRFGGARSWRPRKLRQQPAKPGTQPPAWQVSEFKAFIPSTSSRRRTRQALDKLHYKIGGNAAVTSPRRVRTLVQRPRNLR